MNFHFTSRSDLVENANEDCGWRKPSDVWRDLFSMLSDLRELQVDIHLHGGAEDILDTAFCRDTFASLCLPATQYCAQSQTLVLKIDGRDKIPVCSPVWSKLWQAFSAYRQITIDIDEWLETSTIPDDPFMLKAAGLLASGSLRALHLDARREDQFRLAARIPSITSLRVSYDSLSSSRAAWACIRELAPQLVELKFLKIGGIPVDQSQTAFALPFLEGLELSQHDALAHLEAHLKLVDMPALRRVSLDQTICLDSSDKFNAEGRLSSGAQAGSQKAINHLKWIVRFDTSLPQGCRERQYFITLSTTWHFLPYLLQELAPLLSTEYLDLYICLRREFELSTAGLADHTHETAHTVFSSKSPINAFLGPCRQVLTRLQIDVNQQSFKYLAVSTPVKFARLEELVLTFDGPNIDWEDFSAFFSNWILPVLKVLIIPRRPSDFDQQCATLQDWLPTWPMLRRLTLARPHVDFRAEASQELQKLQEACKNRTPPVSFTCPH